MKYKQKIFIYERREILGLIALILMVNLLTFTLGIHFGKKVSPPQLSNRNDTASKVATLPDQIASRYEFTEQAKGEEQALMSTLEQQLKNDILQTKLQLDVPRQVTLPAKAKNSSGGATLLHQPIGTVKFLASSKKPDRTPAQKENGSKKDEKEQEIYTLQIGSYPSITELKKHLSSWDSSEIKPFWRKAKVQGKGQRYRLYIGKFSSHHDAEQAGKKYQSLHMIDSFIISKLID